MKIKILPFIFLLTVSFSSCGNGLKNVSSGENNMFTCEHGGRKRSFIYVEPENKNQDTKLIVLLHGASDSAVNFQNTIGFEDEAFDRNYAVLYLQGEINLEDKLADVGWSNTYTQSGENDLNFVLDTTAYIKKTYKVGKKVYIAGFSQGAFLVNKIAIERADRFNGFASVAGFMPKHAWERRKNKPAAFFHITGLKDELIPIELNGSTKYNPNPSIEKTLTYFCETNKIGTNYTQEEINKKITLLKSENKVWWMVIQDYHHGWPKNDRAGINVNEYILDFFDKN